MEDTTQLCIGISVNDPVRPEGWSGSAHKAPSQNMPIRFHFLFVLKLSFLIIGSGMARTATSNTMSSTA